jgi:hypothetical protein
MVTGVVDKLNVPAAQLALPKAPGVALLQRTVTALRGTAGQPEKEEAAAATVRVQGLKKPFMRQEMVPVVEPLEGVTSGSAAVKEMLEGETVTAPATAMGGNW